MENPPFWWYLQGKMEFSWAMLVSGRVGGSHTLKDWRCCWGCLASSSQRCLFPTESGGSLHHLESFFSASAAWLHHSFLLYIFYLFVVGPSTLTPRFLVFQQNLWSVGKVPPFLANYFSELVDKRKITRTGRYPQHPLSNGFSQVAPKKICEKKVKMVISCYFIKHLFQECLFRVPGTDDVLQATCLWPLHPVVPSSCGWFPPKPLPFVRLTVGFLWHLFLGSKWLNSLRGLITNLKSPKNLKSFRDSWGWRPSPELPWNW